MSYIFGENTGLTYDDARRKRQVADSLMRSVMSNTPRNAGEGIAAIGNALLVRKMNKDADRARQDYLSAIAGAGHKNAPIAQALLGGSGNNTIAGGAGNDQLIPQDPAAPAPGVGIVPYSQVGGPSGRVGAPRTGGTDEPPANTYKFPVDQPIPQELNGGGAMRDGGDQIRGGGGVADMSGGEDADTLPYGDAKMTGDQSKSIAYYRRGYGANQTLNDAKMAEALTQYTDSFAGNFGALGRKFQDSDYQVAHRAASEFLAAILRKDTGAAITSQEFDLYGPMYLPMPGDKPELIAAKKKARDEALIAIEMGLGNAAPLASMVRDELAPKDEPDLGSLSDDDLMKMLTGGS
ncbi:MAG: hypothetical protein ACPGFC_07620 [Paracoccaceae bacterium]